MGRPWLLVVAGALLAACAGPPASPPLVPLTTGTLRAGDVVDGVEHVIRSARTKRPDEDTFFVEVEHRSEFERRIEQVAADRVTGLTEREVWVRLRSVMRGEHEPADTVAGDRPGREITRIVRRGARWVYEPLGSDSDLEAGESGAVDVAWIGATAAPGTTWSVPVDTLAAMLGALTGPTTMRVTLERVGTHEGRPAVFLTYALDAAFTDDGGTRVQRTQRGRVVRWPALGLDAVHEIERHDVLETRWEDGRQAWSEAWVRTVVEQQLR